MRYVIVKDSQEPTFMSDESSVESPPSVQICIHLKLLLFPDIGIFLSVSQSCDQKSGHGFSREI